MAKKLVLKKSKKHPGQKFAEGELVYFIEPGNPLGGGDVRKGYIYHYNPATKGSSGITEGQPIYTIRAGGGPYVVAAHDVAIGVDDGRKFLHRVRRYRQARVLEKQLLGAAYALTAFISEYLAADNPVPGGYRPTNQQPGEKK